MTGRGPSLAVDALNVWYGDFHALRNVSAAFPSREITALIGPSGCGKTTLLRCINRMNDLVPGARTTGRVLLDREDIYASGVDVERVRRRVGMVFQRPNPFPLPIADNIAFGPRAIGERDPATLAATTERVLRAVRLWDEVGTRLRDDATTLSSEQQQRLCIARALATDPEVLLMDEPCSALDPIATGHVEALMKELAARYTIVIVTHNMQQARRVSSHAAFMLLGELVEFGDTASVFESPRDGRTAEYVAGRFG